MRNPLPRFIGLCGNPGSGKSTVQEILEVEFGVHPVDDGEVLRQFCMQNLGMTREEVYTQAGKKEFTEILGRQWQNREALGELGAKLEELFGENIMPFIACKRLEGLSGSFSFGSVRKTQGSFYRERGGVVIEVVNPLAGPSPYAFDKYDRSFITHSIANNGQVKFGNDEDALEDLRVKVRKLVAELRA